MKEVKPRIDVINEPKLNCSIIKRDVLTVSDTDNGKICEYKEESTMPYKVSDFSMKNLKKLGIKMGNFTMSSPTMRLAMKNNIEAIANNILNNLDKPVDNNIENKEVTNE